MSQKYTLIIAVCMLSLLAYKASATSPETHLLFTISDQKKARLGIVNPTRHSLKLEIVGNENLLLFDKAVSANENYFQLLDLSTMPNGEYYVRLTLGIDDVLEKKFMVINGMASMVKERKEVEPVFKLVDNKSLIVSYLNANSNAVSIFFEKDDEVVFEDRDIEDMPISKRYSLDKLPKGFYVVKLYSSGKVYTYNLSLN